MRGEIANHITNDAGTVMMQCIYMPVPVGKPVFFFAQPASALTTSKAYSPKVYFNTKSLSLVRIHSELAIIQAFFRMNHMS